VEKVIQKVGRQKQILDEIIEKIEEKEKNLDELPEDNQKIDRDRQEKDYLKPLNKDVHETVHDNEITQKILYYKSLLRDRPEKINEIITASRELQEKYPENMDICISLGIAYFKKNLFKEGLVEFAKTLYNKDFFNKKSIQKMINYDIISQKPASLLPDASAGEYDLTDELWEKIKPLIPEKKKKSGRPPMDDRKAMDAIFYVFHKECPWKAIPESLGAGSTVHNRFQKWRHAGVFEALCNNGIMDCNVKKVMSDYCKRRNICF